jgi:hypothetical protein
MLHCFSAFTVLSGTNVYQSQVLVELSATRSCAERDNREKKDCLAVISPKTDQAFLSGSCESDILPLPAPSKHTQRTTPLR